MGSLRRPEKIDLQEEHISNDGKRYREDDGYQSVEQAFCHEHPPELAACHADSLKKSKFPLPGKDSCQDRIDIIQNGNDTDDDTEESSDISYGTRKLLKILSYGLYAAVSITGGIILTKLLKIFFSFSCCLTAYRISAVSHDHILIRGKISDLFLCHQELGSFASVHELGSIR